MKEHTFGAELGQHVSFEDAGTQHSIRQNIGFEDAKDSVVLRQVEGARIGWAGVDDRRTFGG